MLVNLHTLANEAHQCRTPKQFRILLCHVRVLIPYSHFAGIWGYPKKTTIRFVFNEGFPEDLLRWRLTTGVMWASPLFHEWLKTNRVYLWSDAVKELKEPIDPQLKVRMEKAHVQHSLVGGRAARDYFVMFAAAMASAEFGRAYLKLFEALMPALVGASQRAYPRTLLTKRETSILERRAHGQIAKQIAANESISERTVRAHLTRIKKKLYTNDLVNAVVIALRSGMVRP